MKNRVESRIEAYYYVVEKVKNLVIGKNQINKTANNFDYTSLTDLLGLKEGTSDPSPQLIANLKDLLKGIVDESEIDQYLVQPFHTIK